MLKLGTKDFKEPNSGEFNIAINEFKNSLLRLSPDAVTTEGSCTTKSFCVGKKEFSAR
jgi:hypothetical protein